MTASADAWDAGVRRAQHDLAEEDALATESVSDMLTGELGDPLEGVG